MEVKTGLVTGCTGQDGSLLSRYLLDKGYKVFGMARRTSSPTDWRLKELGVLGHANFHLCSGDLTDQISLNNIVRDTCPDEVYNLGAQSFVGVSWQSPFSTYDITGLGPIRLFEAVRAAETTTGKHVKIYQASSSEMFGGANRVELLNEDSTFHPRSPYGVAKCIAHMAAKNYRESYGMFISCGILFNHESKFRGLEFVSRKITHAVAAIKLGLENSVSLGNLDSVRDWGAAQDYVKAMWLMLQQPCADDFVVATSRAYSVKTLCEIAFGAVDLDWTHYVFIDQKLSRPADVKHLLGDYSKAKRLLGWKPTVEFKDMITEMVTADLQRLSS